MNVTHPNYGQNYRLTRAALRLGTFTVSEMVDLTGALKNTVYSFISKLRNIDEGFVEFEEVQTLRGRPQKRYSLTETGTKYLGDLSFEMASRFGEEPTIRMTSKTSSASSPVSAPLFDLSSRAIAYFYMEIALSPALPTYSGGLGMLAGDTLRSAADTSAPMVAVSLVHRCGYFRQILSAQGQQTEADVPWSPETQLSFAGEYITVNMQSRSIKICAWRFDVVGVSGHIIPVFLLDTDIDGNEPYDRHLTDHLYGGDTYYRLCQETVLGLGGVKLLHKLGCAPEVYHMNEAHASFLTLGLLEDQLRPGATLAAATEQNRLAVAKQCVFTTHTPVPAGHDQFGLDQVYAVLGRERSAALEHFGCLHNNSLNMTYLALRFSRWVNGISMQHGKVLQQMFPDYRLEFVTNGVHAATWISEPLQKVFDQKVPRWRNDNQYLRSIDGIEPARISNAHRIGKRRLIDLIKTRTGQAFDESVLTLGFARRVATYKRADLLMHDPKRLARIAQKIGGLQIVYSGKAHPADNAGKGLIREIVDIAGKFQSSLSRAEQNEATAAE